MAYGRQFPRPNYPIFGPLADELSSDRRYFPPDSREQFRLESTSIDKNFVQIVLTDCIREDLCGCYLAVKHLCRVSLPEK